MIAYRITCLANGKIYIGITKLTAEQRLAAHWRDSRSPSKAKDRRPLLIAMRKYPREAWVTETIATAQAWEELCEIEKRLIAEHQANNWRRGYNVTTGGEGAPGVKKPQHAKDAISRALKGRKKSPEHIAKMLASKAGWRKTPEQIERSAVFHRGRKRSDESVARMSNAQREYQQRCLRGEVSRPPSSKIDTRRDAAIAEAYFYERSYERAGAKFGIKGPAAWHATQRAIGRLIENLETISPLYEGITITGPVHPYWLDLAV
ncbi:MAG: GIY-YIG nuclease family protein [Mesorhizobium sp.]|nr:MAG: GIY-YIG nuclease family protein [Mesorhizobium sp.]